MYSQPQVSFSLRETNFRDSVILYVYTTLCFKKTGTLLIFAITQCVVDRF